MLIKYCFIQLSGPPKISSVMLCLTVTSPTTFKTLLLYKHNYKIYKDVRLIIENDTIFK